MSDSNFPSSDPTISETSPPSDLAVPPGRVATKGAKPSVILEIEGLRKDNKRLEKEIGSLWGQMKLMENKHSDLQAEHNQLLSDFLKIKQWLRKNEEGRQSDERKKRERLEEEEDSDGGPEVMTADEKAKVAASAEAAASNVMKVRLAIHLQLSDFITSRSAPYTRHLCSPNGNSKRQSSQCRVVACRRDSLANRRGNQSKAASISLGAELEPGR